MLSLPLRAVWKCLPSCAARDTAVLVAFVQQAVFANAQMLSSLCCVIERHYSFAALDVVLFSLVLDFAFSSTASGLQSRVLCER